MRAVYFALALAGGLAAFGSASGAGPDAQAPDLQQSGVRVISVSAHDAGAAAQRITLALGKAAVVQLDSDARDVLVSDPATVDAVVRTPRRIFLLAQKTGQTNAFFFDAAGHQILSLDIRVERDLTDLAAMIHADFPDSHVKVSALNDNIVLTGSVESAQAAARVQDLAAQFVRDPGKSADPTKIINMLSIGGHQQVMLKVRVAEMQRQIAKQFGVNLLGNVSVGGVPISLATSNPYGLMGQALSSASGAQFGLACGAAANALGSLATTVTGSAATTVAGAMTSSAAGAQSTSAVGGLSTTGSGTGVGPLTAASGTLSSAAAGTGAGPVTTTSNGNAAVTANAGNAQAINSSLQSSASNSSLSNNGNSSQTNTTNGSQTNTSASNTHCTAPNNAQGVLNALEQDGLMHTLAEPNLTAVSGETAKFLAGGSFPVPSGRDQQGNISITFKDFGVGLSFTPVVLSDRQISLQLSTEVSELTNTGAFTIAGGTETNSSGQTVQVQAQTIPALDVRRAETTVELPSGGSFAVAGLIQHTTKQVLDAFPGLMQMPVLGALFRSRDFQSDETELVIIVTAYLVEPTNEKKLASPTDGFRAPSDLETIALGKLNATTKNVPAPLTSTSDGKSGFIVE